MEALHPQYKLGFHDIIITYSTRDTGDSYKAMGHFPTLPADNWVIHYEINRTPSFFRGCCLQVSHHFCQTRKAYLSASKTGMRLKDLAKSLNWEQYCNTLEEFKAFILLKLPLRLLWQSTWLHFDLMFSFSVSFLPCLHVARESGLQSAAPQNNHKNEQTGYSLCFSLKLQRKEQRKTSGSQKRLGLRKSVNLARWGSRSRRIKNGSASMIDGGDRAGWCLLLIKVWSDIKQGMRTLTASWHLWAWNVEWLPGSNQ